MIVLTMSAGALSGKAPASAKFIWHDASEFTIEGKGWDDTASFYDRFPAKAKGKINGTLWSLSHDTAGMCVRFVTKDSFKVRWTLRSSRRSLVHMPATGVSGIDLYTRQDNGSWRYVRTGIPKAATNEASFPRSSKPREHMLYLPLYNGLKKLEIGLAPGGKIEKAPVRPKGRTKPIVFYGTSITQGGCVSRPGMAYTAIVGRNLDVPVINLGFSGRGKSEPEVAALLAELDPSVFVLDPLANMSVKLISERMVPFVKILRKARPKTPIVLAEESHIFPDRPAGKNRTLRAAYDQLKADGVKNIYLLSAKGMLGDDGEGTVDTRHTTDLGQFRQGQAFTAALKRFLPPLTRKKKKR